MIEPNQPLRQLIGLLDLEELDVNLYRGQNEAVFASWKKGPSSVQLIDPSCGY